MAGDIFQCFLSHAIKTQLDLRWQVIKMIVDVKSQGKIVPGSEVFHVSALGCR